MMGVVYMHGDFLWMHKGYHYCKATLYIYCDACGSFHVRKYLNLRKWLSIVAGCALVGVSVIYVRSGGAFHLGWFILGLPLSLAALMSLWGDTSYKCEKCGRPTTWRYNTRHLPSYTAAVDGPDEQVQKRYYDYWSDEVDPEEMIRPPGPR